MIKLPLNYYDNILKLIPYIPENVVTLYSISTRKASIYVDKINDIGAMIIQPNLFPAQLRLFLFNNEKWDLLKSYLSTTPIKLISHCDSNLVMHLEKSNMISKYLKCFVFVFPDNIKTCEVEDNPNILPLNKDDIEKWIKQEPKNVFLKIGLEAVLNNLPCFGYFVNNSPVHITTTYAVAGKYYECALWTSPKFRGKGCFPQTTAYWFKNIFLKGMNPIAISGNIFVIRALKSLGMKEYPTVGLTLK